LNIRALRLFHLVVSRGSLSAAAETMNVGASAASRMIGLLEAETRLRLFHRTRRQLTLTPDGEAFYRESEHILAGFDEIPRIAAEVRARAQRQLRVMTGPRSGQGIVAPALALFRERFPETRVAVDMDTRFAIDGRVGTRVYDLGIVSLPVSHPQVEIENVPLCRVRIEAVLPAAHRLAGQPSISAQDLVAEPLLGLWPGQRWRQQVDDFFRSGGVRPRYAVETRSSLMACQLAREGAGVAVLDRLCAQALDLRGLVLRPLVPERWILFGYVHQTRQPLGEGALAFLACVRQVLERFRAESAANAEAVSVLGR
jgi:DNA-binding transcriptional LysR family regulator